MRNDSKADGKIKVLVIAANPATSMRLALDEEIREITQKVRAAEYRDLLDIYPALAARPTDLLQLLHIHQPHIVHFSGHGSSQGAIILSDHNRQEKPVSAEALESLFSTVKNNIRLVILNACYSQIQAQAITKSIDCTIGMSTLLTNKAAIVFAATFYQAVAFGRSVQQAFDEAKTGLLLEGIPEHTTPQLLLKSGIDASQIYFIPSQQEANNLAIKKRLQQLQETLFRGDYAQARRDSDQITNTLSAELSNEDQARLKYLCALLILSGKMPSTRPLTVIQSVEQLLDGAYNLHQLYSYTIILAVVLLDFAQNGFPTYERKAKRLIADAQQLKPQEQDHKQLQLLAHLQPTFFRTYEQYLRL